LRLVLGDPPKLEGQPLYLGGKAFDVFLEFLNVRLVALGVLGEVEELAG